MKYYMALALTVVGLVLWPEQAFSQTTSPIVSLSPTGADLTPIAADFDGDGIPDPAFYQEASGSWVAALSGSDYAICEVALGGPGFLPVTGDFDGDSLIDPAVYQKISGNWYARLSAGDCDVYWLSNFGGPGYRPMPGDYNGDGLTEIALYQPSSGNWFFLPDNFTESADMAGPDKTSAKKLEENPSANPAPQNISAPKRDGQSALNIQFLASAGQYPTNITPLVGPQTLTFATPALGHSLSLIGRLVVTNCPWELYLGNTSSNAASFSFVSYGGLPFPDEIDWLSANETVQAQISSPHTFMRTSLSLPGPNINSGPISCFFKPNLNFYTEAEQLQTANLYSQFPSALTNTFTLRMEHNKDGLDMWLDGRYLGIVPESCGVITGSVALALSNELMNAYDWPALRTNQFLPLDLASYARTGTTCRFTSEISGLSTSALNVVSNIPFFYGQAAKHIDIGLSRWLNESIGYCDNDTTRHSFSGCPESIIMQAPRENFVAAHVLCAVEPSTNKVPVLTIRVTRFEKNYHDSGGRCDEAFADTTVVLPANTNDPLPTNVVKVGEIAADGLTAGAPQQTLPVYLVTLPLKCGEIPDLIDGSVFFGDYRGNEYLDLELTKSVRLTGTWRKPIGAPSAAHVLAMTLERNLLNTQVGSTPTGNIFYAADNPALNVKLTNAWSPNTVTATVQMALTDYYGNKTTNATTTTVAGNGGVADINFALALDTLGYFDAIVTVNETQSGRELWRQPTSFVLLAPDMRMAGAESPFGVWWCMRIHRTCNDLNIMGPIVKKMGSRHLCPYGEPSNNSIPRYAESELAPYNLSFSMTPWYITDGSLNVFMQQNPNVRIGMVFHETGISDSEPEHPYPELLGHPMPALSAGAQTELDNLFTAGIARAGYYRANHPDVKISAGNSHSDFIVQLIRHSFPTQYVDCFGMEGVAGLVTTENPPDHGLMQEVWWVREMQRIYGCDNIPVSSGFEYITRGAQLGSGMTEIEQAELYVRDALHCLAYGYQSINIGATEDFADSYNGTIYGGGGFVRRNPLLTPKPSYAAWATMTLMLDSKQYAGYLDTGSRSLYALKFQGASSYVYPIWSVRGKRQLTVPVSDATVALTDCMGNTTSLNANGGAVTFEATTAPKYLITATPITGNIAPGAATYAEQPMGF